MDSGLGKRIRQVRLAHRLTQKAFAASLGIGQGFLSSLEHGKKVPSDTLLIALTQRYRLNEDWLVKGEGAAGTGPAPETADSPEQPTDLVPLLSRVPHDLPRKLEPEDILGHIAYPGISPDGYAVQAYGDFMAPTIQDRDLVLFRAGQEAENGDIVLVTDKWGQVILRRYRVTEDGVWLSADNSAYTPFQPGSHSRLVGIVIAVWRRMKF